MADQEPEEFTSRYWPMLLIACGVMVLWYTLGGNQIAGAVGFLGLGWLAWDRLIKPNL